MEREIRDFQPMIDGEIAGVVDKGYRRIASGYRLYKICIGAVATMVPTMIIQEHDSKSIDEL